MQRVINFSGGKTSAYLTLKIYQEGDIVLFLDTTREHEKTYKFIDDFERIEGIPVTRITYVGGFEGMLAKRDYKRLPNRMMRTCTEELKVNTAKRYLKSIGVIRYENIIGFRFDEPLRVNRFKEKFKKVTTKFPLYEMGITKEMINQYWLSKDYTLEIPSILGNCDLCFMKGKNVIIRILQQFPELADKWIQDEENAKKHFGHTYLPNTTYKELLEIAQNTKSLFPLEEMMPAYNCACTS